MALSHTLEIARKVTIAIGMPIRLTSRDRQRCFSSPISPRVVRSTLPDDKFLVGVLPVANLRGQATPV